MGTVADIVSHIIGEQLKEMEIFVRTLCWIVHLFNRYNSHSSDISSEVNALICFSVLQCGFYSSVRMVHSQQCLAFDAWRPSLTTESLILHVNKEVSVSDI